MELDLLRKLVKEGRWRMTLHALKRCDQRRVSINDVMRLLLDGTLVEDYPDDRPFPSCLLRCELEQGHLYGVCAVGDGLVHVITVHWLDPDKWLDPDTRRDRS